MRSYSWQIKETLLEVLGLCVIPNFRYLLKCFEQIYRAKYLAAILMYLLGIPITRWRKISVTSGAYWSLLPGVYVSDLYSWYRH